MFRLDLIIFCSKKNHFTVVLCISKKFQNFLINFKNVIGAIPWIGDKDEIFEDKDDSSNDDILGKYILNIK